MVAAANVAPVIDSFTAAPAAAQPGQVVVLTVQAHDPDCAATCTSGCGALIRPDLLAWSDNSGRTAGTAFSNQVADPAGSPWHAAVNWTAPASDGTYLVTVAIADNGSMMCGGRQTATASFSIVVSLVPNQPPTITALTAAAAALFPGATTTLAATASDPDGDAITYSWSATAGAVAPDAPGHATFQAPAVPAAVDVTCTVTDSKGASSSRTLSLAVTEALPESTITAGLRAPQRLAANSVGELFVVDRSLGGVAAVGLFAGGMSTLWPYPGAHGVAVDGNDHVVVAGDGGAAIYDRGGALVRQLNPGLPLGAATDVAVDPLRRRTAVLYGDAGRIVEFDDTGAPVLTFGSNGDGAGQLRGANAVGVNGSGDVVIGDGDHFQAQLFSPDGAFVRSLGRFGSAPGTLTQLGGVATLADGTVLVTDPFQSRVTAFNVDGSVRETFGSYGSGVGALKTPTGIATTGAFGRLVVASTNGASLQVFRLAGVNTVGPRIALSTSLLAFGAQPVGTLGGGLSVILTNAGNGALDLSGVSAAGDFAIVANACGASIAPGTSCVITAAFSPQAAGLRQGTLSLASDAPGSPHRVILTGTGIVAVAPALTFSPVAVDFGAVSLGQSSGAYRITLNNTGSGGVGVGPVTLAGAAAADFAVSADACSSSWLAPGATCSFQVIFTPAATGTRSAQVTVTEAPGLVQLLGVGTAAGAAPIPALSGWALMVLALALAAVGALGLIRRAV